MDPNAQIPAQPQAPVTPVVEPVAPVIEPVVEPVAPVAEPVAEQPVVPAGDAGTPPATV